MWGDAKHTDWEKNLDSGGPASYLPIMNNVTGFDVQILWEDRVGGRNNLL